MVDNSCIIEGNVKFRDGKKVSPGEYRCESAACIRPVDGYTAVDGESLFAIVDRVFHPAVSPFAPPPPPPPPVRVAGDRAPFFRHPSDSRQSRERVLCVNLPIIRDVLDASRAGAAHCGDEGLGFGGRQEGIYRPAREFGKRAPDVRCLSTSHLCTRLASRAIKIM